MPAEKLKDVEKMISKVMKKKDLSRPAAIDYMLAVATGRLAALWRYDNTLPEGKQTKGIFSLNGRKKPAEKTPKILPRLTDAPEEPPAKRKPAKRKPKKPKASEQIEIAAAE